jgi:hypothetical protein
MLSLSNVISANEKEVAAKVMDGEAILINLSTGAYYSTGSSGGFIWSLIETHMPIHAIATALANRYEVQRPQAEADVLRLCEELRVEGLISVSAGDAPVGVEPPVTGGERLAYQRPALEKFTDMAEMFALDPPLPGLSNATHGKTNA